MAGDNDRANFATILWRNFFSNKSDDADDVAPNVSHRVGVGFFCRCDTQLFRKSIRSTGQHVTKINARHRLAAFYTRHTVFRDGAAPKFLAGPHPVYNNITTKAIREHYDNGPLRRWRWRRHIRRRRRRWRRRRLFAIPSPIDVPSTALKGGYPARARATPPLPPRGVTRTSAVVPESDASVRVFFYRFRFSFPFSFFLPPVRFLFLPSPTHSRSLYSPNSFPSPFIRIRTPFSVFSTLRHPRPHPQPRARV